MIYMKDQNKETSYVSVNTLIQPKKHNGISAFPSSTIDKLVTNVEPLSTQPPQKAVTNPETNQSGTFEGTEADKTADQAAPATETAPESTGFEPAQMDVPGDSSISKDETFEFHDEGLKEEDKDEAKSDKEPKLLQKKNITAAASGVDSKTDPDLSSKNNNLNSLRGSGETLPKGLQQKMEQSIGMDFENVRLHRDEQSAAMAGQLGAKAFTNREDIYFNRGEFNPDTTAGQHLIAHELTHVKQQQTVLGLQYQLQVPAERDRYEQEADTVADKVINSRYQPTHNSSTVSGKKQTDGDSIQLAQAKPESKENANSFGLLEKFGGLVRNIPGYDLLRLIIGRDLLSGQEVKRDGAAWVKAVVGMIPGGALLFDNLEKAKVITKAADWFKVEFQKLNINYPTIKTLFTQAWTTIFGSPSPQRSRDEGFLGNLVKGVKDFGNAALNAAKAILSPEETFNRIKQIFLAPINRIMNFISAAGSKLKEFIFEGAVALAGSAGKKIIGILGQGKGVLSKIISDPVGFLKNLINGVRGGLNNFVGNFSAHLQTGLTGWLFGTLSKAGIALPEKLNLAGIFSLVTQVLGVTWQAIRAQVVKRLGPIAEKVMDQAEKGVAVVGALITKGPLALLEMAKEFIGELQSLFINSIIEWVRNTIIVKAIQKLISMFNPVGAIIQAVITIYNVIQFFIERAKQIAAFVSSVFNSIAEIAGGNIKKAVAAVEDSLAKGLPVAISFLASLVGIGGIAAKIKEIIKKIRKPIDKAVGKVVGFIVGKAKALIGKISGGDKPKEELPKNQEEHDIQVKAGLAALDKEQQKEDQDHNGALTAEEAEKAAQKVKLAYSVFKSIIPVNQGGRWVFEYVASKGRHEGLKVENVVPKRLGGYKTGDVDLHGNLSPGTNRAPGHQNIAADGYVQSHHPIQNEWARRWAKKKRLLYDENKAPAMLLKSSAGSPHAKISAAQRERRRSKGFDTDIENEFNISFKEMLDAGVDIKIARKAIKEAYKYFESIGGFVK
jgi:hypothetical protein